MHLLNSDANKPTTQPIKMSRKILGQVDDEFSVLDEEGPSVVTELTKKIENVFFESSGDKIKLQKIMKEYKHPANLLNLKPPKINPEIESSQQYQSNTSFVMNNEKSLYSSQNYVTKAIPKLSNMTKSILKASDADNGGSLDHVSLVKSSLNTITLLSHISGEFTRKRKYNLKNIVHSGFFALCGPKPGTTAAKVKPQNQRSTFLLGDNLKQAAKDAHRLRELTKRDYKKNFKGNRQSQARDQTKSFLDYSKNGSQNYN